MREVRKGTPLLKRLFRRAGIICGCFRTGSGSAGTSTGPTVEEACKPHFESEDMEGPWQLQKTV